MREPEFDLSADMRLIELQRAALGLATPERPAWETRFTGDSQPVSDIAPPEALSAVVTVDVGAHPNRDVIAGAVVTLSLGLVNTGARVAHDLQVAVPLPGGAIFRPGSFTIDGRPADDATAEVFFGAGLPLDALQAGSRAAYIWKVSVTLGAAPLVVAPHVRGRDVAIVGGRTLIVGRKEPGSRAFSTSLDSAFTQARPSIPVDVPIAELPIYELDEEEQLVYEAADAALSPAVPARPESPAPPQAPAREAVILFGRFDQTTLTYFANVMSPAKEPKLLQHCLFASTLACVHHPHSASGTLAKHLEAQHQMLHRISLHQRLGKQEPIGEYGGELLADLERLRPVPVDAAVPFATSDEAIVLVTELSEPLLAVTARIAQERERWDFVKARQLTLALQAQRMHHPDERLRALVENALRAYAQTSMTVLHKLFVRIRIDRTTALLFQPEPALDAAARVVLKALASAFA